MKKSNTNTMTAAGKALYDGLMAHIEPELMCDNLDGIDQKYQGETVLERAARLERYDHAFDEYDRVVGLMAEGQVQAARAEKNIQRQKIQQKEATERGSTLSNMEEQLDSFDA